jgi:hypothetical protein
VNIHTLKNSTEMNPFFIANTGKISAGSHYLLCAHIRQLT